MKRKVPPGLEPETIFEKLHAYVQEQLRNPGRRTVEQEERWRKNHRAYFERVKRERWERREAKANEILGRKAAPKPLGERGVDVLVAAMEPGAWYARSDIEALIGAERYRAPDWTYLTKQGLVDRRPNPEWRPIKYSSPYLQPPKWLYRLNERGEALKRLGELLR